MQQFDNIIVTYPIKETSFAHAVTGSTFKLLLDHIKKCSVFRGHFVYCNVRNFRC